MTKIILIILFLTSFSYNVIGQKCNKDKLIGEWNYLMNRAVFNIDVDSLKKVIDTITQVHGVWTFYQNGKFSFKNEEVKIRNQQLDFVLDDKTCVIKLFPDKNKSTKERRFEIIYLDEKYLIYRANNNPKEYYFTYLLRRK